MAHPDETTSVASLLEQLIAIAQQQLAEQQAANAKLASLISTAAQSLDVAQQTLESSKRIEQLLGGETGTAPAELRISYRYTLKEGART
jgi:hypothetical protein